MRIEKIYSDVRTVAGGECRVDFWSRAKGLSAQSKNKKTKPGCCGPKETERVFEKGQGEIRSARGSVDWEERRPQTRGSGAAHCGLRERATRCYAQNADKYLFRHRKYEVFTTAVALAKRGREYAFHTTLG